MNRALMSRVRGEVDVEWMFHVGVEPGVVRRVLGCDSVDDGVLGPGGGLVGLFELRSGSEGGVFGGV